MNPVGPRITTDMFLQSFREVSAVGSGRGISPQFSFMDIINQKQVGCPVTNVLMIPSQRASRLRRKIGMRRRKRLNLRLLIQAENRFLLGFQALDALVVPQNAGGLLLEVFGDRMLPIKDAVGLEIDIGEKSVNRGVVNLGYNLFRKNLVLQIAKGPASQRKPVIARRTARQRHDPRDLQRGKNGCDCPLWVGLVRRPAPVLDNVDRPSRQWCGRDRSFPRRRTGSSLPPTTTGCAHGRRPDAPFFRSVSVFEESRHAQPREPLWWVLVPSFSLPPSEESPITGKDRSPTSNLEKNCCRIKNTRH